MHELQEPRPLAPQEERVLDYLADGLTNKQIAREMGLSPATVKAYLKSAYDKLDAKGRGEAGAAWERRKQERRAREEGDDKDGQNADEKGEADAAEGT